MRLAGPLRVVVIILTAGLTWILVSILLGTQSGFSRLQQLLNRGRQCLTSGLCFYVAPKHFNQGAFCAPQKSSSSPGLSFQRGNGGASPMEVIVVTVMSPQLLLGPENSPTAGWDKPLSHIRVIEAHNRSSSYRHRKPRPKKYKCGLPQACPDQSLAFRITSGAANVIGPKICLEDKMLMSSVKNNVGRGLNIALVNGVNGELIDAKFFDMWAGDVNELLKFIRSLHEGTLVFVASYDDPATKMNEETRKIFTELGSTIAKDLAFRDSWVFVGAKGVQGKSPFEQHIKNSKSSNKYEGWPEALEMEGCIPQRTADTQ